MYECKHHIVSCPKYRLKIFKDDEITNYTGKQIYNLCREKKLVEVMEINVQKDHIHLVISIPPKYSVSAVMGFLKGKLALKLFQKYERLGKKYWGRHLWARGYYVSTIGLNEDQIREYVKWQEDQEKRIEHEEKIKLVYLN